MPGTFMSQRAKGLRGPGFYMRRTLYVGARKYSCILQSYQ